MYKQNWTPQCNLQICADIHLYTTSAVVIIYNISHCNRVRIIYIYILIKKTFEFCFLSIEVSFFFCIVPTVWVLFVFFIFIKIVQTYVFLLYDLFWVFIWMNNKMKNKKYHTIGTSQQSSGKLVETESKWTEKYDYIFDLLTRKQ